MSIRHCFLRVALPVLLTMCSAAQAQRDGCRGDAASGSSVVVAGPEEPGERLVVTGRVIQRDGATPAAGVRVRIFQTDAGGWYSDGGMDESAARLCGVLESGADGSYRVETVLPGAYATGDGPSPHLHFDLTFPEGRTGFVTVMVPEVRDNGDAAAGDRRSSRRPVVLQDDGTLRVVADLWAR